MNVAVCIPTFRRPDGLRRLLASLDRLEFTRVAPPRITVFVIDNDGADPLRNTYGDISAWSSHALVYHVEPNQGLVHARNAALAAVDASYDAIAFIDDDEWAEPQWLDALLAQQRATQAAAIQGPVRPVFEAEPQSWMRDGRYFEVGPFTDGEELSAAASGNCLLKKSVIDELGLIFDMRFNRSGGEDVDFFDRLLGHGHKIVAAADAVAYETVPRARMSPRWVLRRSFRSGHTLGTISLSAASLRPRIVRLLKSLRRLAFGAGEAVTLGLVSPYYRMRAASHVAFALGSLAGLLRLDVDHYGPKALPARSS